MGVAFLSGTVQKQPGTPALGPGVFSVISKPYCLAGCILLTNSLRFSKSTDSWIGQRQTLLSMPQ